MAPRPAVFLDRDGTLIEERHYPSKPGDIVLLPDVGDALRRLHEAGYLLIVLTNQSGVARGLFDEEQLGRLNDVLSQRVAMLGTPLDGLYYCPHHPEGTAVGYSLRCTCRKPASGLVHLAASQHDIHLGRSVFIGDSPRDLFPDLEHEVAARLLVRTGHPVTDPGTADHVAETLGDAVDWILDELTPLAPDEQEPVEGGAGEALSAAATDAGSTPPSEEAAEEEEDAPPAEGDAAGRGQPAPGDDTPAS